MGERDTIRADRRHHSNGKQKQKDVKTNAEDADGRTASVTIMREEWEVMRPNAMQDPYQILDG